LLVILKKYINDARSHERQIHKQDLPNTCLCPEVSSDVAENSFFWNMTPHNWVTHNPNTQVCGIISQNGRVLINLFFFPLFLANYSLQNLSFLMGMRNLANLKLQNVTLASYEDIDNILESLQLLSNLSIDNSVHLVKPILNNTLLVSRLTRLRYLSLRYTELVTLTQQNIPENTYLDISYNPLHCDCRLAWIGHKQTDTFGKFLLSRKQTFCETPKDVEGHTLLESVNMTCSDQQTSGMLEQLSDYRMWTTSTVYLSRTSTQVPMTDKMTTSSTVSHSTRTSLDYSKVYIAIGTILLILIVAVVALGVTLYVMKKKRTCQISPDGGETPMEQQPQTYQMKNASSKDMLIKK